MGINLNSLFENMTQKSINKLAEDPAKLKEVISECRETIQRLQGTVTEQNKELEFSVSALQESQTKLEEKESLMLKLSARYTTPPPSLAITTRKGYVDSQTKKQSEEYRIIALQAAAM